MSNHSLDSNILGKQCLTKYMSNKLLSLYWAYSSKNENFLPKIMHTIGKHRSVLLFSWYIYLQIYLMFLAHIQNSGWQKMQKTWIWVLWVLYQCCKMPVCQLNQSLPLTGVQIRSVGIHVMVRWIFKIKWYFSFNQIYCKSFLTNRMLLKPP